MEKIIDTSALTDQIKILLWDRSKSREELAELVIGLIEEAGEEIVRCADCANCIDAHDDGFMYCMRPVEGEDYSETGYCYPLEVLTGFCGFCSYGERRDSI